MVQLGMIQYLKHRMHRACLGIVGTVDQALDPGLYERAGAHRTRLNRNKQFAVSQSMVGNSCAGLAQRQYLRMRRRIAIGDVAIPSTADDLPAADDHRAYGDFAGFESALGAAQGLLHPEFVGSSHCSLVVNRAHGGPLSQSNTGAEAYVRTPAPGQNGSKGPRGVEVRPVRPINHIRATTAPTASPTTHRTPTSPPTH